MGLKVVEKEETVFNLLTEKAVAFSCILKRESKSYHCGTEFKHTY